MLWLAGDGPERGALAARAKALGVEAGFLGFVDRAELGRLYARTRAVVLPSTEGEGLPNALLEAMAHGVPVIATALPGNAELVGQGGRVVPPADPAALASAIVELADPAARAEAARAARARAGAFSWDTITDRLETVLAEVKVRAPRVWMVSPNASSRGGVAAVARQIAVSPLTRKYRMSMLPTYAPGSMLARFYRGAARHHADRRRDPVPQARSRAHQGGLGRVVRAQGRGRGDLSHARRARARHVHGGGFDQFLSGAPPFVRALAHWWFDGTPQMLTLSDRWAQKLAPMFPHARIEVLPNPVEVRRFEDLAQNRFARSLEEPRPKVALFLGDLLERKGTHDLVRAWPDVVRRFPGRGWCCAAPATARGCACSRRRWAWREASSCRAGSSPKRSGGGSPRPRCSSCRRTSRACPSACSRPWRAGCRRWSRRSAASSTR
jgi:glycosyltransferase involved in cell wall biosynthesis